VNFIFGLGHTHQKYTDQIFPKIHEQKFTTNENTATNFVWTLALFSEMVWWGQKFVTVRDQISSTAGDWLLKMHACSVVSYTCFWLQPSTLFSSVIISHLFFSKRYNNQYVLATMDTDKSRPFHKHKQTKADFADLLRNSHTNFESYSSEQGTPIIGFKLSRLLLDSPWLTFLSLHYREH
jgi:hypothetical protein